MKKSELMKQYEKVKEKTDCIVLMIHMPGGETETITNPKVAEKIAYVDQTYNNDLVHSNCKDIYIEDVIFCMKNDTYDFGTAINFLKEGMKIARQGWNGKGMYLFLAHGEDLTSCLFKENEPKCVDSVCMKTAQDTVVIGWLASQTDMLAEDWVIVE